jgi:hypothetical protein
MWNECMIGWKWYHHKGCKSQNRGRRGCDCTVPITTDVASSNLDQGEVYNIMWLVTGRWFSLGPPVSSTNKTDRHDITEILLKVALNTIKQTNSQNQLPVDGSLRITKFQLA